MIAVDPPPKVEIGLAVTAVMLRSRPDMKSFVLSSFTHPVFGRCDVNIHASFEFLWVSTQRGEGFFLDTEALGRCVLNAAAAELVPG